MNEMVKIKEVNGVNFVGSLKELYLDVGMDKSHWSRWFNKNVKDNMFFSENVDYQTFATMANGNESIDCSCTLDMAKHLVIQMPTDNAHKYRQYLIDYEKKNPLEILLAMNKENLAMTCLQLTTVIKEKDELLGQKDGIIEEKESLLIEQKPMVEFADTLLKSKSSILIGDFAKILCEEDLNIGEVRLFDWLIEKGYIYKEHKTNKPYQKYIDSGLFEVKTGIVKSAFRDIQTFTIKVKPKGQLYFYNKLKEDGRFNKNK